MISKILLWVTLIALAIIGIGFAMLNSGTVPLNYHYGAWELPLAWVVGLAISIGLFTGLLVSFSIVVRMKREVAKLRRTNRKLAAKTSDDVRTIPMKGAI